ncbi:hypothetical protein AMTRI_Chr06g170220 [Amborella trichopoda]
MPPVWFRGVEVVVLGLLLLAYRVAGSKSLHRVEEKVEGGSRSSIHYHRKLLRIIHTPPHASSSSSGGKELPDRVDDSCSKEDIVVYQGPTAPLPSGIPTYTVQVLNVCASGHPISAIHLACGWFSSARMVNPSTFRRLGYNDCLLNDGGPLAPGSSLSFQYANTYRYPLSVSSVVCH